MQRCAGLWLRFLEGRHRVENPQEQSPRSHIARVKTFNRDRQYRRRGRLGDRRQARVIMRYAEALLEGVPMLARLITRKTADAVDLSNGVTLEVHTCSFRTVRGYTIVAALLDELAFWRTDDSANPDTEILNALRPAMATVPGAMLLAASSP